MKKVTEIFADDPLVNRKFKMRPPFPTPFPNIRKSNNTLLGDMKKGFDIYKGIEPIIIKATRTIYE